MRVRSKNLDEFGTGKDLRVRSAASNRRTGLAAGLAALLVLGIAAVPTPARRDVPQPAPEMLPVAETGTEPMRQHEQDAIDLAAQIGQRVEVGDLRDESRTVYAKPEGTMLAIEHTRPVRVVRDGKWIAVDATLVKASDGSLGPRAATYGLRLSGGGSGPLLTAQRAGQTFSLEWPGELPKPTFEGAQATYPEVLPDVDLVINVSPDAFSHVLVIKSAEAAQNPQVQKIAFGLTTSGINLRETPEGGVDAMDNTGGVVFEASRPSMWASDEPATTAAARSAAKKVDPTPAAPEEAAPNPSSEVPVDVDITATTVSLTPDAGMLADPGTTYPVYIDPVWATAKRSAYTMVAKGYPSESYWSFDKKSDEGVGKCPVEYGGCDGTDVKRLFYTVPTPYLGKDVLSAQFAVTMTHTASSSARAVQLFKAKSGISKSTTWSNQPASDGTLDTASPTGTRSSCADGDQNVRFDVKSAMGDSYTGKSLTFGMRASDEGDTTAWKRFCGNGQLELTYNRAPNTPAIAKLTSSPGGTCRSGTSRPIVPDSPTFYMYVSDPDHAAAHKEEVRAEVLFTWSGGSKTVTTAYKAGDGKARLQMTPTGLPQNTVVSWKVRAQDDDGWYGGYSSPACEYLMDTKAPPAADIDSPDFLPLDAAEKTSACAPDDEVRKYAGMYSTFTFDSSGTDTVRYRYGFDTAPTTDLVPRKADGTTVNPGGPVSMRFKADVAGEHVVNVVAYDAAGNSSESNCRFTTATRKGVGEWQLTDQAGATTAADTGGDHPLAVKPGVTLGVPGPGCAAALGECTRDRAARFSGASDGYLESNTNALIDTSGSFSVAAWVKLNDLTVDHTAVSQDGTGEPGFTLGYDASSGKWSFEVPYLDVNTLGVWTSTSDTPARTNEWTHLVGVFDEEVNSMRLIVNGVGQNVVQNRTAWKSRGAVQIGRLLDKGGYRDWWNGELSDVAVYDRIVSIREASMMAKLRPVRLGYWPLNATTTDKRSIEYDGNTVRDLYLEGDARINIPDLANDPFADTALVGAGELVLDGIDDRARTNAAVVPMSGSFTVSARVRIPSAGCAQNMTVISQAATKTSGFRIRCTPVDGGLWELVMPQTDVAAPPADQTTTITDTTHYVNDSQDGQHLALVYNAFTKELSFYVDGQLAQVEPAEPAAILNAGGALQLGRAMVGGTYGEYFAGVIDDVRVYSGITDATTVALMANRQEQPSL
ncbi:LamG-like jellyroll fold domain-containing protein [Winogradskya humida]|uniref:LamG-like jellyroll fold domain-containing protein n=1 Tax=Winogradskya humida TaxID=113566 RepID=A0ABQ4A2R2_9ACTN|nr:LamG-like jellyroll fold domain-containing protein [Actinoplanes humidus]GIE25128.1 hypothetical protein Ahu01nite_082300 [Actinoplanes humidus]